MKLRQYYESDLPELVQIINEADKDEHEFIPYTNEHLQENLKTANPVLIAIDAGPDRRAGLHAPGLVR